MTRHSPTFEPMSEREPFRFLGGQAMLDTVIMSASPLRDSRSHRTDWQWALLPPDVKAGGALPALVSIDPVAVRGGEVVAKW
jgi:hypothetical protein